MKIHNKMLVVICLCVGLVGQNAYATFGTPFGPTGSNCVFGYCPTQGPTHVSTPSIPGRTFNPGSSTPLTFQYTPIQWPEYMSTEFKPVTVETRKVVKKEKTFAPISAADRKAPDFIQNKLVPLVVENIFGAVFGRKITAEESAYWKVRARHDKATESKLLDTMKYFRANEWTYDSI